MFCKDGVGNLEGAVRWAIEAISVARTIKLLRYGIADWANWGHRLSALQVHIGRGPDRQIGVHTLSPGTVIKEQFIGNIVPARIISGMQGGPQLILAVLSNVVTA